MKFISYAQNAEDVMLWRALKMVESGFYIDVGANEPTTESVTKAFYERGWHGINIEPVTSQFRALQEARPRDTNLQCAAGNQAGELAFWECEVRGWSTADHSVVTQHEAAGVKGRYHNVPMRTLAEICETYAPEHIHFLKIDVEGFEQQVIEGMDFAKWRPWILVVEATRPNSEGEVHVPWEPLLLAAGYLLAYGDGLNRFYVAQEHEVLTGTLRYPPNVFDEFVTFHQHHTEEREAYFEATARDMQDRLTRIEAQLKKTETVSVQWQQQSLTWKHEAQTWQQRFLAMESSASWRITKPLRILKSLLDGDFTALKSHGSGPAIKPTLVALGAKRTPGLRAADPVMQQTGSTEPTQDIDAILERVRQEIHKNRSSS